MSDSDTSAVAARLDARARDLGRHRGAPRKIDAGAIG